MVMDSKPALTPLVPVSQTSESLSTFFSPEMLMAFQDDLEVSTHGIASARAVRHDNSCPRMAAASASSQTRLFVIQRTVLYLLEPASSKVSLKALARAGTESTIS